MNTWIPLTTWILWSSRRERNAHFSPLPKSNVNNTYSTERLDKSQRKCMPKVHCLVPGSSGAFCIMAEQSFNVCCVGKCLKFISQLLLLLRDGRDFFQSLGLHMGGSNNLVDFIFIRLPKDGMDPRLKTKMCVRFCKSELYGPLKGTWENKDSWSRGRRETLSARAGLDGWWTAELWFTFPEGWEADE